MLRQVICKYFFHHSSSYVQLLRDASSLHAGTGPKSKTSDVSYADYRKHHNPRCKFELNTIQVCALLGGDTRFCFDQFFFPGEWEFFALHTPAFMSPRFATIEIKEILKLGPGGELGTSQDRIKLGASGSFFPCCNCPSPFSASEFPS